MVKISCQTIVYGNHMIKDNMESILTNISTIGYDGVEVGARHFNMERPDDYIELLKKLNLELTAVHVGGNFLDRNSVAAQLQNIENIILFSKKLGTKYLYLSGTRKDGKTAEEYQREAKVYEEMGKRCLDAGIAFCYHNHDWEMINDMQGMKILLEETSPQLVKLVPDVGWLAIAGVNPVKFLEEHLERVEAVHFKDFKGPGSFTELGTGIVDFKSVYQYLIANKKDFWITAEQDVSAIGPDESSKINYEYIASLSKEFNI